VFFGGRTPLALSLIFSTVVNKYIPKSRPTPSPSTNFTAVS